MPVIGEFLDIRGPVDPEVFRVALRQVVNEAECLRLRVIQDGDATAQVVLADIPVAVPVVDLGGELDPRAAADVWLLPELARPIDLTGEPGFAVTLLRLADDHFLICQRFHHLVIDEWSMGLVARRLAEVYTSLATGRPLTPNPLYLQRMTGAEETVLGLPVAARRDPAVPVRGPGPRPQARRHRQAAGRSQRQHHELRLRPAVRRLPATGFNVAGGPTQDLSIVVADRDDGRGWQVDLEVNAALYIGDELAARHRLPVDPDYPAERISFMLADAASALVLDALPDVSDRLVTGPAVDTLPSNPAYVIYTSGSAGQPKGVVVGQGSVTGFAEVLADRLGLGLGARMLQLLR